MRHLSDFSNTVMQCPVFWTLLEISTIPFSSFWISGLFHVIGILITISPQAMIMIDWQMWWQQHLLCTWSNKSSRYRSAKITFFPFWKKAKVLISLNIYTHICHGIMRGTVTLSIYNKTDTQFFKSCFLLGWLNNIAGRNGSSDIVYLLFLIITMIIQINLSIS